MHVNKLSEWLSNATTAQKNMLARLANTSIPSLRLASKGYRKEGRIDLSAEYAARIELASTTINKTEVSLPPIGRESLCESCSVCPYQLKCNAPK